jgi:hypothetical protein
LAGKPQLRAERSNQLPLFAIGDPLKRNLLFDFVL